jgi:transposase-like protein
MSVPKIKCPKCGSRAVWNYGYIPTREGKKQRYKCTDCAHSFYKTKESTVRTRTKKKAGK